MFMAHGFLGRLFEVFERFKTPVDVVTTSEVSVSVTVDDARRAGPIIDNLREFAEVSLEGEMAIICAVGEDIHEDPTAFVRAVSALGSIPLRMVSQALLAGTSPSCWGRRRPEAMNRLHDASGRR
jgi:aspartate kinase